MNIFVLGFHFTPLEVKQMRASCLFSFLHLCDHVERVEIACRVASLSGDSCWLVSQLRCCRGKEGRKPKTS